MTSVDNSVSPLKSSVTTLYPINRGRDPRGNCVSSLTLDSSLKVASSWLQLCRPGKGSPGRGRACPPGQRGSKCRAQVGPGCEGGHMPYALGSLPQASSEKPRLTHTPTPLAPPPPLFLPSPPVRFAGLAGRDLLGGRGWGWARCPSLCR